jgi:hypothetical protein
MATSTYLANPSLVRINSVDLSDQCTSATLTNVIEALEQTAFGSTARTYTAGLANNEVTLTLYMSYAATETYATLNTLVGTRTTVEIRPGAGAQSATNPTLTLTDCYLESLPVANMALGELSTIDITLTGGTLTKVTAP